MELVDGTAIVSLAPTSRHQRLPHRMQIAWDGAIPAGCELLPGVDVVLNGSRLLIPDLAVTEPGADTVYYRGTELLMAVEIHLPSTWCSSTAPRIPPPPAVSNWKATVTRR
ncbi:MAG TPA: hypothetical protein VFX16_32880 [Pseudonocardiaceae bacterium]|nr:hypothetical protein [Pseudonocardiaceae bacterium]